MLIPTGGFGWVTAGRTVAERARAAGSEVVAEPEERAWGYCATFTNPDGHMWQVLVPARA